MQQSEYLKIKTLKKLPGNPRIIKDAQFKTLCNSLKANPDYFEARPLILSNRTGELIIIAGNQRYEAAKNIGLDEVPCFLLEGLTEERERELIIRDNVANGEWDHEALAFRGGENSNKGIFNISLNKQILTNKTPAAIIGLLRKSGVDTESILNGYQGDQPWDNIRITKKATP